MGYLTQITHTWINNLTQITRIFEDKFLGEDKLPRRGLTKPRIPRSEARRMWGNKDTKAMLPRRG